MVELLRHVVDQLKALAMHSLGNVRVYQADLMFCQAVLIVLTLGLAVIVSYVALLIPMVADFRRRKKWVFLPFRTIRLGRKPHFFPKIGDYMV